MGPAIGDDLGRRRPGPLLEQAGQQVRRILGRAWHHAALASKLLVGEVEEGRAMAAAEQPVSDPRGAQCRGARGSLLEGPLCRTKFGRLRLGLTAACRPNVSAGAIRCCLRTGRCALSARENR